MGEDSKKKKPGECRKRVKKSQPVTPKMLVKALETLQDNRVTGYYFTPLQVTEAIAENNSAVEQDFDALYTEVKDKLVCAAAADIVGFKIDSGYFVLTFRDEAFRTDTRSELTFWMMYKKIMKERGKTRKSNVREGKPVSMKESKNRRSHPFMPDSRPNF